MVVKAGPFCRKGLCFVGPFCRKGLCSLLQPATRSAFLKRQHVDVERTSALVVRLTAKVQPGRLDLPKSATAPVCAGSGGKSLTLLSSRLSSMTDFRTYSDALIAKVVIRGIVYGIRLRFARFDRKIGIGPPYCGGKCLNLIDMGIAGASK